MRRPPLALALLGALLPLALAACGRADDERAGPARERAAAEVEPREPRFRARRERALGAKPEWLLAADLDGDGRAELLAATITPGELRVFRGTPQGLAESARPVAVGGYPLRPVALAARSPAGRRLVAVASRETRRLALLDVLGEEPERPEAELTLPATPRALGAGSLGADVGERVAVACDERQLVLVDAGGAARELRLHADLPRCLRVARDGAGLWIGFQDTRSLHFHPAVEGELGEPSAVAQLDGIPRDLLEVDLDGDGELELVVAGGDGELWIFGYGPGGGSAPWRAGVVPAPRVFRTGSVPIALAAADLDGDGRPALVVLQAAALTWSVWSAFGADGPARRDSGYAGQTPRDLALVDWDGDGRLDLVVAARDSHGLSWMAGDGQGFARAPRQPVGGFPISLACEDLDGDGRPDALVACSKDDALTALLNRAGVLESVAVLPVGPAPRAVRCADLDGDGSVDVALLSMDAAGARIVLLFRGPDGRFGRRAGVPDLPVGRSARDLLLADLTGNGRPDLVVADAESDRVVWIENPTLPAGELGLLPAGEIALSAGPCALAAIELDGDPLPEIAVALCGPGAETGVAFLDALRREGRLSLELLGRMSLDLAPLAIVAADFDGDGREDLALAGTERFGSGRSLMRLLLREPEAGRGGFRLLPAVETSHLPQNLAAGDLDGDGRADLVVASQLGHVVDLWLARDGPGGFELQRLDGLGAGVGCFDVVLVDVDGDGRLDLVVADAHSDSVSTIYQLAPLER